MQEVTDRGVARRLTEKEILHEKGPIGVQPHQIQRGNSKVDLLIGSDYYSLFPRGIRTVGDLQLMRRTKSCIPFLSHLNESVWAISSKGFCKKKNTMKGFRIIFAYMLCRGVYLDTAEGYDANSFLRALRRFTSLREFPKAVYSDRGS